MSLPPERISVKRRRQEEPVDTLILDHSSAPDKKRRFTDFFFQRLRNDKTLISSQVKTKSIAATTTNPSSTERDDRAWGIPIVKGTAAGDEVTDFQKYKVKQDTKSRPSETLQEQAQINPTARRFHLTRNISSLLKADPAGGIRRPKSYIRPPLATFIERHPLHSLNNSGEFHQSPPKDSILEVTNVTSTTDAQPPLDEASILGKTPVQTFLKPSPGKTKSGHSIRDDPTTWDQDSDQLANELAALAFDIDPAGAVEPPQFVPLVQPTTTRAPTESTAMDIEDDFVLETYIRVKCDPNLGVFAYHDAEVGVLIIDDENEDLWEKYIHDDDDDDEWNEEDEDSNAEDNPRNDYPDDEVSSDDEYGHNVYRHRRYASDNEEFDEARDGW